MKLYKQLFTNLALWGFAIFFITITSCKITLIPAYNAELSKEISASAKKTDSFFIFMLAKSKEKTPSRAYENFINGYADIQVELNSLYSKNKVRPLNENSTRICEIAIKFWDEYKNHHIHDDIQTTNANIILRQLYMRDIFFAMNVAEEAKKIIAQSQNTTNP